VNSVETYQEALGRYAARALKPRAGEPSWLEESRRVAVTRFLETGFPTEREESWRYNDLTPLLSIPFSAGGAAEPRVVDSLRSEVLGVPGERRLVFVDGRLDARLSSPGAPVAGLRWGSLAEAIRSGFEPPQEAWEQTPIGHAFFDLNTALFEDGALVVLEKGVEVLEPLHLVFLTTFAGAPSETHPRNLILLGENARMTVVESHLGGPGAHFSNHHTQTCLSAGAGLNHAVLQEESLFTGYSVGSLTANLKRDARLSSALASLGGHRVRNEVAVRFTEPGAECTLDGVFLARCQQHVDCRTFVDHAVPGCTSHQTYKGVLDGRSTSVFEGRVLVRENAQKTDANQSNKNLLMSQDAIAYSKPQLEIYANDVKCSHGSATGPVDPDVLFYLRSRGIILQDAKRMLVRAFVGEVLERFRPEGWVDALKGRVRDWLVRPEDENLKSNEE
jgi:Fe-S cluster assembly protein SufD